MNETSSGKCFPCKIGFGYSEPDIYVFKLGETFLFAHSQCGPGFGQKYRIPCVARVQAIAGVAKIIPSNGNQEAEIVIAPPQRKDRYHNHPSVPHHRRLAVPRLGAIRI